MNRTIVTRGLGVLVGASLVLGAFASSAAFAQANFPVLRAGKIEAGKLAASDPGWSRRGPFKAYRFDGAAGDRVGVVMRSSSFDAFLTVGHLVNGLFDPLAMDDDSGGGNDARVVLTLPKKGTYIVVAQSFPTEGAGAYTVELTALPKPKPAVKRPLTVGQTVEAALALDDAVDDDDPRTYQLWTFTAKAGEPYQVDMMSSALDAFLIVGLERDGAFVPFAGDDDGGDGNNARVRFVAPEDGTYIVRATAMPGNIGPYTLRVSVPVIPPATPIRPGETVRGALSEDDGVAHDGTFHDDYTFVGKAGQTAVITLESPDFDAFLVFGRGVGPVFTPLTHNDDFGEGTSSRIEFELPADGAYTIRANSVSRSVGAYVMTFELR